MLLQNNGTTTTIIKFPRAKCRTTSQKVKQKRAQLVSNFHLVFIYTQKLNSNNTVLAIFVPKYWLSLPTVDYFASFLRMKK